MTILIRVKASTREVERMIKRIPQQLASKSRSDLNKCLTNHLAYQLFGRIEKSFRDKSDGGTDEFGKRWTPLKPETIAQRPITFKDEYDNRVKQGEKGLLTPGQLAQWKAIFRSVFVKLRLSMGDDRAKALAGKSAWAIMKSKGAKTRLDVLGRRKVKLLRISDRLFDSISQGTLNGNRYYKPYEQIFKYETGELEIGTNVPYAKYLHKRRRIIPTLEDMAKAGWVKKALYNSATALAKIIAERVRGLRR